MKATRWKSRSVTGIIILVTAALTITPILFLVYGSLSLTSPWEPFQFSVSNYVEAFTSADTIPLTVNTLIYALFTATLSVTMATVLALIVTRTDTPWRGFLLVMPLMNVITPALVTNVGWVYLFSPRTGLVNTFFMNLGFPGPVLNIYSLGGMVWATGTHMVPISFLIIAAAMRNMDKALEEASRISGGGIRSTFRRITLPLSMPAILSAWLLAFVTTIEVFETPAMIGARAGIYVYMSEIYRAIQWDVPPNFGLATSRAVLILAITMVLVYVYRLSIRRRERYQVITGKGYRPEVVRLGRWKWVTLGIALSFFVLVQLMPFLVVVANSFQPFWDPNDMFSRITFENYAYLTTLRELPPAFLNSIICSVVAASLVGVLAAFIAFISLRTAGRGRGLLDGVAMLPISFPGLVLGVGLFWTFVLFPSFIYGTIIVLILAYTIRFMPHSIRTVSGQLLQISKELEEASKISGASRFHMLRTVTFPLLKPALASAWVYTFIVSFRELSSSVLLVTQNNRVVAPMLFELWIHNQQQVLSAVIVIMVGILWAVVFISHRFFNIRIR